MKVELGEKESTTKGCRRVESEHFISSSHINARAGRRAKEHAKAQNPEDASSRLSPCPPVLG